MPSGDFSCPDIEGDHVQEPKDPGEFACYSLRYARNSAENQGFLVFRFSHLYIKSHRFLLAS